MTNSQYTSDKVFKAVAHIIMILLAISCLYPFLLIVIASFSTNQSIINEGFTLFPSGVTLDTYKLIFANPGSLADAYKVTIFTTAITTVMAVFMESSCGYVMSRPDYRYKGILSFYVFFTMIFNGGMVPGYILITQWLHLKDNVFALILPNACTAWNIILCKSFFMGLPFSLIESAKLDGAKEHQILLKIIIPLSKPIIATITLFTVLAAWNEWTYSLLFIDTPSKVKLQYLLMAIMSNIDFLNSAEGAAVSSMVGTVDMPTTSARMAMCVLAAGPMLCIFPFFQKYFVKGVTIGAVKG